MFLWLASLAWAVGLGLVVLTARRRRRQRLRWMANFAEPSARLLVKR